MKKEKIENLEKIEPSQINWSVELLKLELNESKVCDISQVGKCRFSAIYVKKSHKREFKTQKHDNLFIVTRTK